MKKVLLTGAALMLVVRYGLPPRLPTQLSLV